MSRSYRGVLSGVRAVHSALKKAGPGAGLSESPSLITECVRTAPHTGKTFDSLTASAWEEPSRWRGFASASTSSVTETASPQPHYEFLEIVGVGYRASTETDGSKLLLKLGFSHDVNVVVPEGMKAFCLKPTAICLAGHDKVKVSQFAAYIRGLKPPEPYKGKGIRYRGELVRQKQGKKK